MTSNLFLGFNHGWLIEMGFLEIIGGKGLDEQWLGIEPLEQCYLGQRIDHNIKHVIIMVIDVLVSSETRFQRLIFYDYTFASKIWLKLVGYNRGGISTKGKQLFYCLQKVKYGKCFSIVITCRVKYRQCDDTFVHRC